MSAAAGMVLLVEDAADHAKLTQRALHRGGFMNPIAVASDGAEALDFLLARGAHAARAGSPPPALVILDLVLPRLAGLSVLEVMRAVERTRHIPVVVFTSSSDPADVASAYEHGANSCVRKPAAYADFMEAVKLIGTYWLAVNQPFLLP